MWWDRKAGALPFFAVFFSSPAPGALIFETLWLRLSGLAFGNSIWAAALILSSFMAGLALGNALAASSRIRRWRPLHFYAVLELFVAFFGCTIVFGLPVAWRFDAARVANAVELSADAAGAAVRGFLPDFARANNSHGFDAAGASLRTRCCEKRSLAARLVFFTGQTRLGRCLALILGEAYLIGAFGLYGTSLAAAAAVCIAAAIALLVARFGAARYVADFKGTDQAARSKFPLQLRWELSAAVAFAFRQFWHGSYSSRAGSHLVPIFAAVCRIFADGFRHHARGCAGGNRTGRTGGRRD